MKKILRINEKHYVTCYSTEANYFSILSAHYPFKYDNLIYSNAWIEKKGNKESFLPSYKICEDCDVEISTTNNKIKVKLINITNVDTANVYLYDMFSGNNTFAVRIEDIVRFLPWAGAGIKLESENVTLKLIQLSTGQACFSVRDAREEKFYHSKEDFVANYLKIILDDGVSACISEDGIKWEEICFFNTKIEQPYRVGIHIWTGRNGFEDWFYFNHISLKLPIEYDGEELPLEFIGSVKNYNRYNIDNPWILQNYVDWSIEGKRNNIVNYLKNAIKRGYYVDVFLNQKYVPDRMFFGQKNFEHDELIYGYDDKEKIFMALGYDKQQKYVKCKISYSDLKKAHTTSKRKELNLIHLQSGFVGYSLPKWVFRDALCKVISDKKYVEYKSMNGKEYVIGVAVLDYLSNHLERMKDYRVAYMIYSYSMILHDFVLFLCTRGYIRTDSVQILCDRIIKTSKKLYKMVLLCMLMKETERNSILMEVKELLGYAKDEIEYSISRIIDLLESEGGTNLK